MTILNKYSSVFIQKLEYTTKRYIYIRDVSEKKCNMDNSVIQFYRQLLLKDILRRDYEYCILCKLFPGDISELILKYISSIEPEKGMVYLGRPPYDECVGYKLPSHLQISNNIPQYLKKYNRRTKSMFY
jgi:hypothetical protein